MPSEFVDVRAGLRRVDDHPPASLRVTHRTMRRVGLVVVTRGGRCTSRTHHDHTSQDESRSEASHAETGSPWMSTSCSTFSEGTLHLSPNGTRSEALTFTATYLVAPS